MRKQQKSMKSSFLVKSAALVLAAVLCGPTVYTAVQTPTVVNAATPAPTGITAVAENGTAVITWNAVSGGKMYAVYLKDAAGNVTLVHNRVSGTTYTVTGLKDGGRYGFVVKAYTSAGWGGYSATTWVTANVVAKAPENVTAAAGDGEVTIRWDPSYGAQTYAVFLKDTAGNVTLVQNRVNGTSYTVKGLKNGVNRICCKGLCQSSVEHLEQGGMGNGRWCKSRQT